MRIGSAVVFVVVAWLNQPSVSSAETNDTHREVEESGSKAELTTAVSPLIGVVNLNTATESELGYLPGIGPARAHAILQLRQKLGRFRALTDIIRVRGIGPATYRRLKPMLTLDGPTTLRGGV